MFANLHNGQVDMAARWACALLVRRSQDNAALVGGEWERRLHALLAAQGFRATSERRWLQYAGAVAESLGKREQSTNRRWAETSAQVKATARALADAVQGEMDILYRDAQNALGKLQ